MAGGGHALDPMGVHVKTGKPLKYFVGVAGRWAPSAMCFGFFSASMALYFTDWKVVMNKLPFYRNKFQEKEPLV